MPDAWEKSHGLDPADPKDGPRTAANGYMRTDNASRSFSRQRIAEVLDLPTDNASRR
jgi:hypothetical protein